jgi:hypothetical protein
MTRPVDLDALDAAHAAATPGEWEVRIPFPKFPDLAADVWVDPDGPNLQHVVKIERNATATATAIAALHNAYPAMAAELRERRAREEATVRLLRDALESLVALRQGYVAYLEIAIENGEVDEVNECEGDEETIATADARIDAIEQVLAKKGGV